QRPYVMSQNSGTIGFQGITDGTSNTALWSEGVTGSNLPIQAGTGKLNEFRTFFVTPGTQTNPQNLPVGNQTVVTAFLAQCNSIPVGTVGNTTTPRGISWQVTHPYFANYGMYNHVNIPNSRSCTNVPYFVPQSGLLGLDVYGSSPPTSFHTGGVNVAMCD